MDTRPTDWRYLSEGGATMVFSYIGPPNPVFERTVLRVTKHSLVEDRAESGSDAELAARYSPPLDTAPPPLHPVSDPTIEFHKCMQRLIPPAHLPLLKTISLGPDHQAWLRALAEHSEPQRPAERRKKDGIDVRQLKAVLATDLIGGQGIAVEIKPKWGFLPSPKHLSDTTVSIKTRTCRFCMHSHFKAQHGEAAALDYCPLDLFSGDESRVKKALASLWDAWTNSDGTVNNLRVFVRGTKIGPAEKSSIAGLVDDLADPKEALISAVLPVLINTPVLHTLSRLQRTLDALDIEGLAALWERAPVGRDPRVTEWNEFVSTYLAAPAPPPPADAAHLRYHVLAYLLSAAFKDCSVIVRVPDGTATVIDLDPKSVDRLHNWERLDKEIVTAYATVQDPKSFRERVDVTSIIRSILDSYPLGNGILRELLQNSDDASATTQTFILDLRTHPSGSLVDPDLINSQGPALLAVNDSLFTEADWNAIRTIHNSSKTEDETKTGKFGIGVRASYHITDNPQFFSGSKLGIFDPHNRFSGGNEGGVQIDVATEGTSYRDQLATFDRFIPDSTGDFFNGTVVRLPLRTPQQASTSTIKQVAVDPSEIKILFKDFVEKELSVVMLFLKHIRSIRLEIIDSNGVETFIGSADIPDLSISEKRTFSRNSDARQETFKCTVNVKSSRNGPTMSRSWRVVHTVGSSDATSTILKHRLGYNVAKLLTKDKLFSHVALAFPIDHDGVFNGRLFTLLPLPILTGFPAHVHAILALTQDRQSLRNIQEVGTAQESRERLLVTWNRTIFDEFLPSAWSGLLRILVEEREIRDIWSAWPNSGHVNDYWKQILPNLLSHVLASDLPVFPIFPDARSHVSLSSALIASPGDDTTLLMALSRVGLLIVLPPQHIRNALISESTPGTFLHPDTVRTTLLSRISTLTDAAEEDKDRILQYLVLPPGTISNAIELPLVPLVDGSRISLLKASSPTVHVLVTGQEAEVFGGCDDKLISLSKMSSRVSEVFRCSTTVNIVRLDATKVKFYLETAFGNYDSADGEGVGDKIEWLTRFWRWMFESTWADKQKLLSLISQLHLLPTSQGTLRRMHSRIVLPIGGRPGKRRQTTDALAGLGVHFLHADVIPYKSAFQHVTVQADDIAFVVDSISPHLISGLDEDSARLIQNYVVQSLSTLQESLEQDPANREAFISKFVQLPIFPTRVVAHDRDNDKFSRLTFSHVSRPLVYTRITDHCPLPLTSDHTFFDVVPSSGILGSVIDPTGYSKTLDELDILEMAIDHLKVQPSDNFEALVGRIIRRLPDLSLSSKDKLQSVPFVPVHGRSEKMSPNQIIDPRSELAGIYRGEPGKLPDELWAVKYLPMFTSPDFFLQKLTPEIVTERINFLSGTWTGSDLPAIFNKAKLFLMLLDKYWTSICQDTDIADHLAANWLPIKDQPKLAAPDKCRDKSDEPYLFDLVLAVVDVKIRNPALRKALGWVEIPIPVLKSQFRRALTDSPSRATRLHMLIKEFARRLSELSDKDITDLKTAVSDRPWVPNARYGTEIVKTKYALLQESGLGNPLSRFPSRFHAVAKDLLDGQGRSFLQKMGCLDRPCLETLLLELELLGAEARRQTHGVASWQALDILKELGPLVPDPAHDDYSRILVPGTDNILRPIAQVYFVDTLTDSPQDTGLFPAHTGMFEALARQLKIQFLSSMELGLNEDDFDDLQMGEDFTKRVEGVLKDHDVQYALNEFLANTVDAKGSKFSVILDERTFESSKVIAPGLADLQRRPSLFLFNNAVFTSDDFRGLRTVGQGGKDSDPDSIGRYGLGALSLFHFTDVVILISADRLLILDPTGVHLPPLKKGKPRTSLMMRLSDVSKRYPDQLSCFDSLHGFSKSDLYYNGTLFRLPLRSERSAISPTALSISDCLNLLTGPYFELAKDAMHFTCLDHVSAQQRPPVGVVSSLWSVSASRKAEIMVQNGIEHAEIVTLTVRQNSTNSTRSWLVTKSITPLSHVPPEYSDVLTGMKLHASKVGLVVRMAFPLPDTQTSEIPKRHSLFSSLRLPVHTSLPAHVHAQFSLSSDRRHIRYEPPDGSGRRIPQAAYNHWILSHLVPPLYISSISYAPKPLLDKSAFAWWPTLPAANDEISRTMVEAFYSLLPKSSVPICFSVTSSRIAPIDATFCGSETPSDVIKILCKLKCPNLVHLHRLEIYELISPSMAGGQLQTVDPEFVRNTLEKSDRGTALTTFFTNKEITAGEINSVLLFLLKGKISIVGLPLLLQADNSLVCASVDGPVKYVPQSRLTLRVPILQPNRFLQVSADARDLLLQSTDVNIKLFDEAAVLALLQEQIPIHHPGRCTHSSATIAWIANFWQCYERLPGPPKPSSFDTLPLIQTTSGEYISAKYSQKDDAISEPQGADMDHALVGALRNLGILFYRLPAPLEESYTKALTLRTCMKAIQSTNTPLSHLSLDETHYICEWIRSRVYYCADADKNILSALSIWEATQGNIPVLLPERQVHMLPFPSLRVDTFAGYLKPAIALAEFSLPLQTVIRWSPVRQVTSSTQLAEMLELPQRLRIADVQSYSRLLQAFLSLQDGKPWQLPVPDGNLVLRPASELFDQSEPLFSIALQLRTPEEELFLHPLFRTFQAQLRSKGLKFDIDWNSFLRCVRCIQAALATRESPEGPILAGARIVYLFYNSRLPSILMADVRKWEELRLLPFIPRNQRRSTTISFSTESYCSPLPVVVSPSQVLRQEHEQLAWTQRALFQEEPIPNLVAFNPSLGVPNANEVVNHLVVLALRIAPEHPGDPNLLQHIRATYGWLNQHVEDASDFLRGRGALFLNVTDPDTDHWDARSWCSASQLLFDVQYDYPETGSYRVRDFLRNYRPLLIAAGANVEHAVEFRPATQPQDSSGFREAFNAMRQRRQLTNIQLVPTAPAPDEEVVAEKTWAHSTVLAAAIPHVREALVNWSEGTVHQYQFPGTYFGACAILDFIYTGKIERTVDADDSEGHMDLLRNLLELLPAADQWNMPELKDEIGRLIEEKSFLSRDTYKTISSSANDWEATGLIKYCQDWADENPGSVPLPGP
ncbi:inositol-pentakisphosphate 2-kinase-domain-containing protein [Mycena epipterygia]|nr:inositol-pentakisphosphate 2-kinase-domain-containing protein [Mycena epipterygia]